MLTKWQRFGCPNWQNLSRHVCKNGNYVSQNNFHVTLYKIHWWQPSWELLWPTYLSCLQKLYQCHSREYALWAKWFFCAGLNVAASGDPGTGTGSYGSDRGLRPWAPAATARIQASGLRLGRGPQPWIYIVTQFTNPLIQRRWGKSSGSQGDDWWLAQWHSQ